MPVAAEAPRRVAIVGAGPVGLYLAARLARDGFEVAVLEARARPSTRSRAIGVHPPGLAALAEVGAAEELLDRGVAVRRGVAYGGDGRPLGTLDFERTLPGPHRFVTTAPQPVTEAVLAARLEALAPGALRRGIRVEGLDPAGDGVRLRLGGGPTAELGADLCVLCVGASGAGAAMAGVPVAGGPYPDDYLMGDAPDATGLGADAAIHLSPAGVVEAFPLPDGMRRWVAWTPRRMRDAGPEDLARIVAARTGARIDPDEVRGLSAFGVARRLAARLAVGRVWLAGDAAHVVSPIGGQGMNVGWLGARTIARELRAVRAGERTVAEAGAAYDAEARRRARRAAARAEWNMRAGRPRRAPLARDLLLRGLLTPAVAPRLARRFTMQA